MTIREFCDKYNNIATAELKDKFIKNNLTITKYVPFLKKDIIAQNIVNISTYKFEDYVKADGSVGRRKTDNIEINSTAQMLFFYRAVIENYTNLEIETKEFYEEYDALNESGLLQELTLDYENHHSLIPASELSELRGMIEMKKNDVFTNYINPQSYISNQLDKILNIANIKTKSVLEQTTEKE